KVDSKRSAAPKNSGPCTVKLAICGHVYSSLFPFCCPLANLSGLMFSTSKSPLIRLTNETIAKNKPIGTAIVKLTKTVNKNVVTNKRESEVLNYKIEPKDLYSLILKATTIKIGAILASGTW